MPIEIKELHIKVKIDANAGTNPEKPQIVANTGSGGLDKETLIAECVEQVMQLLQNKKER